MRSDYGKLLRKEFEQSLTVAFPEFSRSRETAVPQGCRLYEWRITSELIAYVLLVVSPSTEHFTVEVAWTRSGPFPFSVGVLGECQNGSFRIRLSQLWNASEDYWWKVTAQRTIKDMSLEEIGRFEFDFISPPPAMIDADRVVLLNAVKDAIQRIRDYAIPYLEQVAREAGKASESGGPGAT